MKNQPNCVDVQPTVNSEANSSLNAGMLGVPDCLGHWMPQKTPVGACGSSEGTRGEHGQRTLQTCWTKHRWFLKQ
ncbi:hypothetical protein SK128_008076, partial [Halocaridina rubra]